MTQSHALSTIKFELIFSPNSREPTRDVVDCENKSPLVNSKKPYWALATAD